MSLAQLRQRLRRASSLLDWLPLARRVDRDSIGRRGEALACRYLERQGYVIRERRVRSRLGEIDVVAMERGDLVFVEVKARRGSRFGAPSEAVGVRKQRKLVSLAQAYVARHRLSGMPVRFDVVSVKLAPGEPVDVSLIRAAFEARI